MRTIKDPESYGSPKDTARVLRNLAAKLETGPEDTYLKLTIQINYADRAALEAAAAKLFTRKES